MARFVSLLENIVSNPSASVRFPAVLTFMFRLFEVLRAEASGALLPALSLVSLDVVRDKCVTVIERAFSGACQHAVCDVMSA